MEDHILAALLVLLSIWVVFYFYQLGKPFDDIPGPASNSWLYGNMLELILHSPYGRHEFEWQKQYGSVYSIKGCIGENRLMVSDSTALRYILSDLGDFRKSPQHQLINRNVFGKGSVLYTHGPDHRRLRGVMNPAFSTRALRGMVSSLQECAHHLAERWENSVESSNGLIDIFPDLHEIALKGVSECVMDYDITEDNEYTKSYDNLVITGAKRSEIAILTHSVLLALPTWVVNVLKLVPPPDFRTILSHRKVSYKRAGTFLNKKIEARNLGIELESDLFNVLLDAHAASPEIVSLEEIKDQFGTITVAGEDTTANAMLWTLYELSKNSKWQEQLRAEVAEVGHHTTERGLEFYDRLPFLNALIKEVLRFYAPLPYTERIATRDTLVPVSQPITTRGGKQITEVLVRKGQYVQIAITSYNRLPSVWGPDADQFRPTRWLNQTEKVGDGALGPYANILTFIGGPRTCLGWRFAVLEMQVIICELVGKFAFSFPDGSVVETAHAISLVPVHNKGKTELPLKVELL